MPALNPKIEYQSVGQDRCSACQGEAFDVVGPPSPGSSVDLAGRTFVQPPFEARRCRHCHLMFKSKIAAPDVLDDYYRRMSFEQWNFPGLHPTERIIVKTLRELPAKSRILDFGCSIGRVLSHVIDRHECFGIEINAAAAKVAAEKGITMLPPNSLELDQTDSKFDAVVAIDIFEHLTQPLAVLKKLAAMLRPGGRLIICTGNSDAAAVRGEPALFWYLELIEHLCMLNLPHARFIERELGLTLVKSDAVSHYDMPLLLRFQQRMYSLAFEGFHRSRSRWLPIILGWVPKLRNARNWTTRPIWNGSADHLVLQFQK